MADLNTTITVIDACGQAHVPSLLISPPGQGKSSLIRGLAAAQAVPCEVVLGSQFEPAEIGGLPYLAADGSGVRREPPAWAKRLADSGAGYVFLDELTTVPESVQGPMLTVALDRIVGDLALPDGVRVVAGANPVEQAAGGYDLAPPMANRFCHINYAPSVQDWLTGMAARWKTVPASRAVVASNERKSATVASVLGFINHRPDLLDRLPDSPEERGGAWPSRRTWTMLADVLAYLRADDLAAIETAAVGLVGEGAALEFLSWLENVDLPDPAAVTADPSIVDWARERQDRVWAVLNGVVTLAAEKGSVEAFRAAWKPLGAAADAGVADMAAAAARTLATFRPASTRIPVEMRKFEPMLRAAGLLGEDAA
jgi:hypothetical protein